MKFRSAVLGAAAAMLLPVALQAADTASDKKEEAKPVAAADAKAAKVDGKSEDTRAKCEYVTGSRIRHVPPVDCEYATPGLRSYSADDIANTGQIDMSEALRWLDPRLR
jgi:hypothetical protein